MSEMDARNKHLKEQVAIGEEYQKMGQRGGQHLLSCIRNEAGCQGYLLDYRV